MIIFKRKMLPEKELVIIKASSTATWMRLADLFFNFLQGCGYYLSKKDLGAYYTEESEE